MVYDAGCSTVLTRDKEAAEDIHISHFSFLTSNFLAEVWKSFVYY
jgi:hypothetical protein